MPLQLLVGPRVRKSVFFDATVAAGLSSASVYNHMYMPTSYGDADAEYWRLINAAALWDVAVQRQVQIVGPDAARLVQLVSARDLSGMRGGQGRYTPLCDHDGRLLNDPLTLKVEENRYWISIADGDMLLWCLAIARERGFDVEVSEPDVSALAVQGPLAEDVVAALLGEWIREIKFFWFAPAEIEGIPLHVGRAGFSKQGGFELYLTDGSRGTDLWNLVSEAGQPFGIGPGAPNYFERIESNLLSFRADTDDSTDPFEAGLGRYVNLDTDADFIGKDALIAKREAGLQRQLVGVFLDGPEVAPNEHPWPCFAAGRQVGKLRVAARSPRLGRNIGLAMLEVPYNALGAEVEVACPDVHRMAEVTTTPFC